MYLELALVVLLVVLMYQKSHFLNNFVVHPLAKLVLLVAVVAMTHYYGRNAGIFTAIGIGVGIYVHCFLAINGISLFILENELYKLSISIIGSSYIFYLGISMLRSDSIPQYNQNNSQNSSSIYDSFFFWFNYKYI